MKMQDEFSDVLFVAIQIVMALVTIYAFGFLVIVPQLANVTTVR